MCIKSILLLLTIIISESNQATITNSNATTIEECLQDAINITAPQNSASAEHSIQIPEDRKKDHVFEVMQDDNITMLTDNSTRSCVCRLRQCIQMCSYNVHNLYDHMIQNNPSMDDMNIFYINLTLANGTIVRRHFIHDFQTIVYRNFCNRSYSLPPQSNLKNSYSLFENETLLRHDDETYLTGPEYCFDVAIDSTTINPLNCITENILSPLEVANNATMVISIPFFLLTILAYCMIPELWNLHGKCFISYLSSITLSYSLISCINLTRVKLDFMPCILLGYLNHYLQLAYYTWLGIICYDTWKSFSNLASNGSYRGYAFFGWLMPLLWTILTLIAQFLEIPEYLKPGITAQQCGLEANRWSASIYLYGPCSVVLLFCLISFILTSRILKQNDKDVHQYQAGYDGHRYRYTLYLRLFVVMGLSWFMDVVSYLLAMFKMSTSSYLMDFINAVQGLYIFLNFIGRHRVRNIIKEKFLFSFQDGSYTLTSISQRHLDVCDGSNELDISLSVKSEFMLT